MSGTEVSNEQWLSRGALIRRRFLRNKLAVAGLVVLISMFLLAFVGPNFGQWKWDELDFNSFLQPPSRDHFFGTSMIGGDVYALTLRGLQKSLIIGLLVAIFSQVSPPSWAHLLDTWVDAPTRC